jgi:hypothetical protein
MLRSAVTLVAQCSLINFVSPCVSGLQSLIRIRCKIGLVRAVLVLKCPYVIYKLPPPFQTSFEWFPDHVFHTVNFRIPEKSEVRSNFHYSDMWNLYERSQLQAPLSSDLFCFRADSAEIYE